VENSQKGIELKKTFKIRKGVKSKQADPAPSKVISKKADPVSSKIRFKQCTSSQGKTYQSLTFHFSNQKSLSGLFE
jgi:hypothetical protein